MWGETEHNYLLIRCTSNHMYLVDNEMNGHASIRRSRGCMGGAWARKWWLNHKSKSSPSIHPFFNNPYTVPGTSPIVSSGLSFCQSKITQGRRAYPEALEHESTTSLLNHFSPEPTAEGCF